MAKAYAASFMEADRLATRTRSRQTAGEQAELDAHRREGVLADLAGGRSSCVLCLSVVWCDHGGLFSRFVLCMLALWMVVLLFSGAFVVVILRIAK